MAQQVIQQERLEQAIFSGFVIGTAFLVAHVILARTAAARSGAGRAARIAVELQRKSFHMVGGCVLATWYHWGLKWGYFSPACLAQKPAGVPKAGDLFPLDGAAAWVSLCFLAWVLDAARMHVPAIAAMSKKRFGSILREKEMSKAAGTAYFIPGTLVAMLAAPADEAILGILFLSIGDAASSLGSAAGVIPVFKTSRRVEGSIGCFVVCTSIAVFVGIDPRIALVTSAFVTAGELLAEIIGLDDNVVLPLMGVLGLRIARAPQYPQMLAMFATGFVISTSLALAVASVRRAPPAASAGADPAKKLKH